MSNIPSIQALPPADPAFVAAAEQYIARQFPGTFLVPFSDFARLEALTPPAARNLLSAGAFPVPVVQHRNRNFVAAPDVVNYLAAVWQHKRVVVGQLQKEQGAEERQESAPKKRGAPVKNPRLKANAAIARAALAKKRAAKAEAKQQAAGGAA